VNLLVHVSENHQNAVVISFPRDLLLDIPACPTPDETESTPRTMAPLNTTMGIGGLPCVALTIEQLTGLDVGYAGLMTFAGVAQLSTAVGGVEVCVSAPLIDPWSGINLPEAGYHTLEGYEALAFLRTRKGVEMAPTFLEFPPSRSICRHWCALCNKTVFSTTSVSSTG